MTTLGFEDPKYHNGKYHEVGTKSNGNNQSEGTEAAFLARCRRVPWIVTNTKGPSYELDFIKEILVKRKLFNSYRFTVTRTTVLFDV